MNLEICPFINIIIRNKMRLKSIFLTITEFLVGCKSGLEIFSRMPPIGLRRAPEKFLGSTFTPHEKSGVPWPTHGTPAAADGEAIGKNDIPPSHLEALCPKNPPWDEEVMKTKRMMNTSLRNFAERMKIMTGRDNLSYDTPRILEQISIYGVMKLTSLRRKEKMLNEKRNAELLPSY
jgi:hypothetical protein